jgi:hypothetical protein
MKPLLAALTLVLPGFLALHPNPGSAQDAPDRITPEIKARTNAIAQALENLAPGGFTQKGPVERYAAANLYEKINGRSELFHAYDVAAMAFVTFSRPDDPAQFIDVFLYEMTTPLGAFGVYSVERSPESRNLPIGDGGHRAKADLFFRKGQYYASILTSGTSGDIQQAAATLAQNLANRLKGQAADIWGLAILPARNRIDDSVQYLMVDALGLDFLANTFTAQYRIANNPFTAFVARSASADQAAEVLAKYRAYLQEFSASAEPAQIQGTSVLLADVGGSYDAVCQVGDMVAGVTAVKDRAAAVEAMRFLLEGMRTGK